MSKRKIILFSILILLFLMIGLRVRNSDQGILFDIVILDQLHKNFNPILFIIMKILSFIGSAYFLIPVMIIVIFYMIIKKRSHILKLLLLSTLGSYILNFFLKLVFNRVRPLEYFLVDQSGLSFPSGHSMITMTFYMTLAYIISRRLKKDTNKKWIYLFSSTMIILIGISRLYLGVHWPTDIIGGYLIGYVYFNVIVYLLKG